MNLRAVCAAMLVVALVRMCAGCDWVTEYPKSVLQPTPVVTPLPTPYMDALTEVRRLMDLFDPWEEYWSDVDYPGSVRRNWQYVELMLKELPDLGYPYGPGVLLTYKEANFLNADKAMKPHLVIRMDNGDLVCYVQYLEETERMIEWLKDEAKELEKQIAYVRNPKDDKLHYVIIADNPEIFTDFLNDCVFHTPGPAPDQPAVEP